jgi:hypothetical protein
LSGLHYSTIARAQLLKLILLYIKQMCCAPLIKAEAPYSNYKKRLCNVEAQTGFSFVEFNIKALIVASSDCFCGGEGVTRCQNNSSSQEG